MEVVVPVDPSRLPPLRGALAHHGVTLTITGSGNARNLAWQLVHKKSGRSFTVSFDADVERVLTRLRAGEAFAQIDLLSSSAVHSTFDPLTGGPFCAICAQPGGLPCPAMLKQAQRFAIKLAFPEGDCRLIPNHVHPGKCRANLRKWLDAAQQEGGTSLANRIAPSTDT